MLQNAYFLAKIGADTAENEQHFAEILPKNGNVELRPPAAAAPPRPGAPLRRTKVARDVGSVFASTSDYTRREVFLSGYLHPTYLPYVNLCSFFRKDPSSRLRALLLPMFAKNLKCS